MNEFSNLLNTFKSAGEKIAQDTATLLEKASAQGEALRKRLDTLLDDPDFEAFLGRFAIELGMDVDQSAGLTHRTALRSSSRRMRVLAKLSLLGSRVRNELLTSSALGGVVGPKALLLRRVPAGVALGFTLAGLRILLCGYEAYLKGRTYKPVVAVSNWST